MPKFEDLLVGNNEDCDLDGFEIAERTQELDDLIRDSLLEDYEDDDDDDADGEDVLAL